MGYEKGIKMKPILDDYYRIFLTCALNSQMKASQKRMLENVKSWAQKDYDEQPTFEDVKDFLDSCQDAPVLDEFIDKIFLPLLEHESANGETKTRDYLEFLREEGRIEE